MEENLRQRLGNQLSRGDLILFTGAGFSRLARNKRRQPVPSVGELREAMWGLAFPGEPLDAQSTLADIYECASTRAGGALGQLLNELLVVESNSIPELYRKWFSMPWYRIYTLNVDNLDEASDSRYELPLTIHSISALRDGLPVLRGGQTLSIHLNGRIVDYPSMTFSSHQYGERAASPDPWYQHLVADLSSHPVLFVGTTLDESLLWQYIELRKNKQRGLRELRPGSYLVTPSISTARRAILEEFNVQLVQMTQEEFLQSILEPMEVERTSGLMAISSRQSSGTAITLLQRVAELRTTVSEDLSGEFLLGRQPTWADIVNGTAAKRAHEEVLTQTITDSRARVIVITGTAGSGKSTTLMRVCLEYQASGKDVLWLDPDSELTLWQIRNKVREKKADILAIDDIDMMGSMTGPLLSNLAEDDPDLVVIVTMRSTRFDKLKISDHLRGILNITYVIPHLEDADIDQLLDVLTKRNKLGRLRALTRPQQVKALSEHAGRQLLVAMIEATSGERFEEKIDSECKDLGEEFALIYATVALASNLRTYITQDELLLAVGNSGNEVLNKIAKLVSQRLVIKTGVEFRLRHRVIADRAVDYYRKQGQLTEPVLGLLWAMATKVHLETPRYSREGKLLSRLMNHDFLKSITSNKETPRKAYFRIENLMGWNYHYFLQRGSFEVEEGDINLAKNLLDQARAMAPDDYMVQTEWSYMTLKRAASDPGSQRSIDEAEEAFLELEDAISHRGPEDSYPYHVLGSQGLSWARRANIGREERRRLLERLLQMVKEGVKNHRDAKELQQLADDLQKEYLMMAVPDQT